MKYLIFGPYSLWTSFLATNLETMQNLLDKGEQVVYLDCNREFPACDANPGKNFFKCFACMTKRKRGLSLLSKKVNVKPVYNLGEKDFDEIKNVKTSFTSIKELKEFRIEDFELGYSALSSLIQLTRNPTPNLEANKDFINKLMGCSLSVYRSVQNYIRGGDYGKVIAFNGRLAPQRAVFRACESMNIDYIIQERGCDRYHYHQYPNTYPHDINYVQEQVRKSYQPETIEKSGIGCEFYEKRRQGIETTWMSFITNQKPSLLPNGFDPKTENNAVFLTTEYEVSAFGSDWENPIYENQLDGLKSIIKSLDDIDGGFHLYIRLHPNSNIDNEYMEEVMGLKAEFLTIIPPDSQVSSYKLLDSCDKILTFGSTMGIEAVFWGKPSILAGRSLYETLGGTYNPKNHEELMEFLTGDLKPKDKKPALMYGYYFNTFGTPYRYFKPTDNIEGKFRGKYLQPGYPVIKKIGKIFNAYQNPDMLNEKK